MRRFIGGILIVAASAAVGMAKVRDLKRRRDSLRELLSSFELLQAEITFKKTALPEAFARLALNKRTGALFKGVCEGLGAGVDSAWEKSLDRCVRGLCLSAEDRDLMRSMAGRLGKTDTAGQLAHIGYISERLKAQERAAAEEYRGQAGLYGTGSILVGVLSVLLLI